MLPGVGLQEMLLIAIVAITVVGPKDLPLMLRKFGRWVAKMRSMAHDFQSSFEDLARQAELDELRQEVQALRRDTARDLDSIKHAAHLDESILAPLATAAEPPQNVDSAREPELPLGESTEAPVAETQAELQLEPSPAIASASNEIKLEPSPAQSAEAR